MRKFSGPEMSIINDIMLISGLFLDIAGKAEYFPSNILYIFAFLSGMAKGAAKGNLVIQGLFVKVLLNVDM